MDYSREEDGLPRKERELTLSMSAILGIFFGLVLLCGLFFGLGYNMRGRQINAAANVDSGSGNSTNPAFNNFKPAAGSPAESRPSVVVGPGLTAPPGPPITSEATGGTSAAPVRVVTPASGAIESTEPTGAPSVRLAPAPVGHPTMVIVPTTPSANGSGYGVVTATPVQAGSGSFVVQVAAVSHQEDADLLMGALKGRGYAVNARAESQDKLIHIQLGPFGNRKDAESMRQRLQGDGYNAIIK